MKNARYVIAIACLAILFGCKGKNTSTAVNTGHLALGKHCYTALFQKDSAGLNFDIDKYGKVTGHLYISYGEAKPPATEAEITTGDLNMGEFRGDTLFADYTFTSKVDRMKYTNPVALLHKGDSLIMGAGKVMSYLGRSYFDPNIPINFQKSRFRFKPGNCK